MKNLLNNHNGFTLIEAVISLGVLSIGILAMFSMQTLGIRGNANASRISSQATWGANEAEQILTAAYAATVDTAATAIPGDAALTIQRTTVLNTPITNIKTVTITITNVKDGKQVILRDLKRNELAY